MWHINLAKGRVRHNDGIPIAGGDFGKEPLPVLFGKIRFIRYKNIGVRVQFIEFITPLVQQMIRYNNHGLGNKAHAL